MGLLPHFSRRLSCPQRTGRKHCMVLRHSGRGLTFHACPDRHCGRPLDTGPENTQHMPLHRRRVHACRWYLRPPCHRTFGRNSLHSLHSVGSLLHAHNRSVELGSILSTRQSGPRQREALPSGARVRYCRFYMRYAVCQLHRLPEYSSSARHLRHSQFCNGPVLAYHA